VPGVTQTELEDWESMREDDDPIGQLASSITRATPDPTPISATPEVAVE
jgi:hypothetical protein